MCTILAAGERFDGNYGVRPFVSRWTQPKDSNEVEAHLFSSLFSISFIHFLLPVLLVSLSIAVSCPRRRSIERQSERIQRHEK
jgi:hypothetical protein